MSQLKGYFEEALDFFDFDDDAPELGTCTEETEYTDWEITWEGRPRYTCVVDTSGVWGVLPPAYWKKSVKVREERIRTELRHCYRGSEVDTTELGRHKETRHRTIEESKRTKTMKFFFGRDPVGGDALVATNPWTGQQSVHPIR